jgi:hypothetical protein
MNKKIVIAFVVVFSVGILIGYVFPYLQPKKTIYDKLRDANISFSQDTWYENDLQTAKYIQQIRYFEEFKQIYDEKHNPLYSNPNDIVHVNIDPSWNVVWITTMPSDLSSIEYIGFYFYSEPD